MRSLEDWDEEPFFIPRKHLKTNKFKKERDIMGRPHTNDKRGSKQISGNEGVCFGDTPKGGLGKAKQYPTQKVKAGGPNYPKQSVTGVFQDGRKG